MLLWILVVVLIVCSFSGFSLRLCFGFAARADRLSCTKLLEWFTRARRLNIELRMSSGFVVVRRRLYKENAAVPLHWEIVMAAFPVLFLSLVACVEALGDLQFAASLPVFWVVGCKVVLDAHVSRRS